MQAYLIALVLGISILPASPAAATENPCHGQQGAITGDAGDNTIQGTEGDDVIDGGPGNDTIDGLGGVDVICGDDGDDTIDGGDGDDTIDGGAGDDLILGGLGDDTIDGGDGDDAIEGGEGNDPINGGPNSDSGGDWIYFSNPVTVDLKRGTSQGGADDGTDGLSNLENVYGSPGPDTIFGDDGPNYLVGWEGNDFIGARNGDDVVNGMTGHDAMFGGGGLNDWLVYFDANAPVTVDLETEEATVGGTEVDQQDGLSGFESISGSKHNDSLYGDAGTNYLSGGDGSDTLDGRGGFDIATFYRAVEANLKEGTATSSRPAPLPPGGDGDPDTVEDNDLLLGLEGLWGSPDWDTLIGDTANNLLRGDAGSDEMRGAGGQDYFLHEEDADHEDDAGSISGGAGSYDIVDHSLSPLGMEINLQSDQLERQLLGIEGLVGSMHSDTFTGNDRANYFFGKGGDDILRGKRGKDGLAGGEGEDELVGGRASDHCTEGEEIAGCEEVRSPKHHPLVSIGGSMARPETLGAGAGAGGPDDPRRYK